MRRTALALALVPLLLAPARAQEEKPPVDPAGGAAAAPAAETEEAFLLRITDEMLAKIGAIRGLKMKRPVERKWTTREQLKVDLLAELEKEVPPEKVKAMERGMAFLGLVPEGTDIKEVFSNAMASGVLGYYLPDKKVFFLVKGFDEDGSRPIVFHELTHAVEDQYYDYFDQMKKWSESDQSDRANAVKAVVEGSAQRFTDRFLESEPGLEDRFFASAQKEALAGGEKTLKAQMEIPPCIIIEMVLFPYHNGSRFLKAVLAARGEPKEGEDPMAPLYNDPPASTEMILHPEKYLGVRDLPQEVTLPHLAPALGEGWKQEFQDTMGELSAGVALNAWLVPNNLMAQIGSVALPPEGGIRKQSDMMKIGVAFKNRTGKAVAGWDGDRFAMFGKDAQMCLAWSTVWDTPADAGEFAETYGSVVETKYENVKPAASTGPGEWSRTVWKGTRSGCSTAILSKDNRVLVAERIPDDRLEAFVEVLARSEVKQDPKDALPAPAR